MKNFNKLFKHLFIIVISGCSLFVTMIARSNDDLDRFYRETVTKNEGMKQLPQDLDISVGRRKVNFVAEYQELCAKENSDLATKARTLRHFLVTCLPAFCAMNAINISTYINLRLAGSRDGARNKIFWDESFFNLIEWLKLKDIEPYSNDIITTDGYTILTYFVTNFNITPNDPNPKARLLKEQEAIFLALQKGCDPNMPDNTEYRNTPLVWAIANDNKAVTLGLINKCQQLGISINLNQGSGKRGVTPLILCIAKGHPINRIKGAHAIYNISNYDLTKYLLANGADPNVRDKNGDTPLHIACLRRDYKTVQLLVNHKAYGNLKNKDGLSPADYLHKNYKSMVVILMNIARNTYSPNVHQISDMHELTLPGRVFWNGGSGDRGIVENIESLLGQAPVAPSDLVEYKTEISVSSSATSFGNEERKQEEQKDSQDSLNANQQDFKDADIKGSHSSMEEVDATDFDVNKKDSQELNRGNNNSDDDGDGGSGACQAKIDDDKSNEQPIVKHAFEQLREIIVKAHSSHKTIDEAKASINQFIESQNLDEYDVERKELENIAAQILLNLYGKDENKKLYDQLVSEIDLERYFERSLENNSNQNNKQPVILPYLGSMKSIFFCHPRRIRGSSHMDVNTRS